MSTSPRDEAARSNGRLGESYTKIVRAKDPAGSETAWSYLHQRYHKRARLFAEMQLGPRLRGRVGVDDLMQEVWLRTHGNIRKFQYNGEDSFYRWICQNIRRIAIDWSRKRFPDTAADDTQTLAMDALRAPGPGPATDVGGADVVSTLRDSLQALPELYREILLDVFIEGRERSEVARERGLKDDTLKKQLQRGMDRWRRQLDGVDPLELLS